ncbi:VOC family protein [Paracraurococcus lichenis]|uniref:VOC family protein n=1 Tax=Paracraurococcus lichenis TaxID=3064888 RepID=A0ABT9E3V8_9PROT|nr:VOC family protein [Paracraurococcus sp. LOR1-02]MDO9710854.1 VOC family protein [Paracraurococcus sp. LOR1-02]
MAVQALGYLGLGVAQPGAWSDFATRELGLQAVDRGGGYRAFRMDDRKQRLLVDSAWAEGEYLLGWEVADAAALEALAARLEAAGTPVRWEGRALADQRCVAGLISFQDPAGNRLEAFHGGQVADEPFRPGRDIAGFRAGPLGMGHVLLMVPQLGPALEFYCGLLGFKVSDYMRGPVSAYFLHVNARHHTLALVEGPQRMLHHLMMELYAFDDVGRAYDMVSADPARVAATLGRHPNDLMTSFYMRTPSPILVEYGWGGREVDDATWQPEELTSLGSLWGHKGLFDALGGDGPMPAEPPPFMRPAFPRAPLQVMEGNYQRMAGVCPWWDAARAAE